MSDFLHVRVCGCVGHVRSAIDVADIRLYGARNERLRRLLLACFEVQLWEDVLGLDENAGVVHAHVDGLQLLSDVEGVVRLVVTMARVKQPWSP